MDVLLHIVVWNHVLKFCCNFRTLTDVVRNESLFGHLVYAPSTIAGAHVHTSNQLVKQARAHSRNGALRPRATVFKTNLDTKIPPRHFIHDSILISTDPPSPARHCRAG
jgi:hypothetical protein